MPHGFVLCDVSNSAAASSAQSGMEPGMDGISVAPSCMPLPLLGDVSERVGSAFEDSVGVSGGAAVDPRLKVELMLRVFPFRPALAAGADVGRSMVAPIDEVMLVCRSPVVSCREA